MSNTNEVAKFNSNYFNTATVIFFRVPFLGLSHFKIKDISRVNIGWKLKGQRWHKIKRVSET